jgi:SAM-dependent methyltransferase
MTQKINKILKPLKSKVLNFLLPNGYYFSKEGYCPCCKKEVTFEAYNDWFRDNLLCPNLNCCSVPRERALALILEKNYPNWRNLKIHESSPCERGASILIKKECKNYTASQYYPNQPFGSIIDGFVNQDLENQTFENEAFDIIITQDVFEHIYDPAKAFAEIARTLKPGGVHLFSVPIENRNSKSETWAIKGENGKPVFLKTPEYHGNPVDAEGSPVTMHWGFDIVDFIKEKSGLETTYTLIEDMKFGIKAEYLEIFESVKI